MPDEIPPPSSTAPSSAAPGLGHLFAAFATISLCGFGGVLAWSRLMLVERRRWMTPDEFNNAYALCQFLPGPNVVNLSVVFGRSICGWPGAFTAFAGLLGPPFALVIVIGTLYARSGEMPVMRGMLTGVAAAAAGLLAGTWFKMALPLLRDRLGLGPAIAILTFASLGLLRWPLHWCLAVLLPISLVGAWVRR